MAVAVKNSPQAKSANPTTRLAVGSLLGAVYVIAGYCLVVFGIPYLWWDVLGKALDYELDPSSFVNVALFLLLMLGAVVALVKLPRLLTGPQPTHGLYSGVAVALIFLLLVGFLTQVIGVLIENMLGDTLVGLAITLVVAVVLVFFCFRPFFRDSFARRLGQLDDQGWFTTTPYKASQGQRVRRGTILGLLILAGCGIYTMMWRSTGVETTRLDEWSVYIPFTDDWALVLVPARAYLLPLLLTIAALWFSWRVVNFPVFADFLIATDAEMNKVSWTTRKRLVQDTIVVLVTVFLLTLFLLVVDVMWNKILSSPLIRVVPVPAPQQTNPATEKPEY